VLIEEELRDWACVLGHSHETTVIHVGYEKLKRLVAATRELQAQVAELETERDILYDNLSKVYDYVSGGKVSKPLTDPQVVIQLYQQEVSALHDQIEALTPQDDEDTWYCPRCHTPCSTEDLMCGCGYEREEP